MSNGRDWSFLRPPDTCETAACDVFETADAAATKALGRSLACMLKSGDVVAFHGELGSGKTTMIKGVCEGLGVTETVKSPTFVIVTEYHGRVPVYHIDLYRLESVPDGDRFALDSYFREDGICLIEWAERAGELLPPTAVHVWIEMGDAPHGAGCGGQIVRRIRLEGLRRLNGKVGQ